MRGFTLLEMVLVIVIIGVVGAMVAVFIRAPVQGYFDLESRAGMTDAADTAMRRIGRDLRLALPNSVRVNATATAVEFLQTRTGGRYRAEGDAGNPLQPGEVAAVTFDVLGGMPVLPVPGDQVVVYNLGITGANAYDGGNRAEIDSADAGSITLTGSKLFPLASPGNRFHVVDTPVTYRCENGVLRRYWGYAIASAQPDPPAGGQNAIIAENVTNCLFNYEQNIVNQRWGLVSMSLTLSRNNENVNLYHEVHVSNIP